MKPRVSVGPLADDRAVSAVVGLVVLFGIVVAGTGIVFVTGMQATETLRSTSEVMSAERSMEELGATFSTLGTRGGDAAARVQLSANERNEMRVVDGGTIRFRLNGKAACTAERELGSLVYEHESGVTLAYQAGAVFRQSESGTTVVRSPGLEYGTETVNDHSVRVVSFPVTNVSGEVDGTGGLVASPDADANDGLEADLCLRGPDSDEIEYVREVTITVEDSDYYRAWHRYFRSEFGSAGTYSVDHDAQTASVTAPLGAGTHPEQFRFDGARVYGALFSTASSGELLLQTKHATVDSFDSGNGPWGGSEPAYGDRGDILTRGSVDVQANGAQVAGNVFAEGEVDLSESCGSGGEYCVDGDVYVNNTTATGTDTSLHPGDADDREERISGAWDNGTTVPELQPLNDEIERTAVVVSEYNENDDVAVVDGRQIQFTGGTATVENGVYYLDELTVPAGNTLELNTSDGDVVLVVEDDVDVGPDATISVVGDGQVRVFVNESTAGSDQLRVAPGAVVKAVEGGVRTYRANALFVACKSGCSATFEDAAPTTATEFTGVLYGPGRETDDGTVRIGKHVDVWGALVAGSVTFEQQGEFHFDTQLVDRQIESDGDGDPDIGSVLPPRTSDTVRNAYVVSVSATDVNVSGGERRLAPASALAGDAMTGAASDAPSTAQVRLYPEAARAQAARVASTAPRRSA